MDKDFDLGKNQFPPLNFPVYQLSIKKEGSKWMVFDAFRKKYVRLSPEEWVRQHLAHFLVHEYQYPASLLATEASIGSKDKSVRADILVYDRDGKPLLIAECKAPQHAINQSVFDQASAYNYAFRVKYLLLSNGLEHYCCLVDWDQRKLEFLEEIPLYENIR